MLLSDKAVEVEKSSVEAHNSIFSSLKDEELALRAKNKDNLAYESLVMRYKNLVRFKARSYFLIGADKEDIVQEGMIGLFKAIRDFRDENLASFKVFAEVCITRQIITAIKTATRNKHIPLNTYVSFNTPVYDDDSGITLEDIIGEKKTSNPEELVIIEENLKSIKGKIEETLSSFEYHVLEGYLSGSSYQDIALELGKHVKSIDNALQRIKRKLGEYLLEGLKKTRV